MSAPEHLQAWDRADRALRDLLWELPAEFSRDPDETPHTRHQFMVIKQSNVRKVHEALWELQKYIQGKDTL